MKKITSSQKQSITKQAQKNFKIWDSKRIDKTTKYAQCKSVKYWFVADKGEIVLSFYKSTEPKYLKIKYNKSGRAFVVSGRSSNSKTHYIHRLQAEAFPDRVYRYGKAKDSKSLKGFDVHHISGYKVNEPELEEVLEPKTHNKLFNKDNVPLISDDISEHITYMETVSKIAKENAPEQATVVFSGSGIVNGVETKDLGQCVYADDMHGVNELVQEALNNFKGLFLKCTPEDDEDRKAYEELLKTPGEAKKLEEHLININSHSKEPRFFTTYKDIKLMVEILYL